MLATHYHADHVGGDIFGEHIQGLVDLLELADVPVHVQKDEVPWVAEMTGVPVHPWSPIVTTTSCKSGPSGSGCYTPLGIPRVANASWSGTTWLPGDTLFIDGCGRTDLPGADPGDMYSSLQRLASLPGRLILWPGHHYSPALSAPARRGQADQLRPCEVWSREEWLRAFWLHRLAVT